MPPPPAALSRAEYTASTRGRAFIQKRAQSEKIVSKVGKTRVDDLSALALRRAQKQASRFFKPPPEPPAPAAPAPPAEAERAATDAEHVSGEE